MAQKFPYTPTAGALVQFLNHLRKSFPASIDAGILKKLGLAPNNESYILSVLRFLGLIDEKGARNSDYQSLFSIADDAKFSEGFSKIVHQAYGELFNLRGEDAWELDKPSLSTFFRQSDGTSAVVGDRQVNTFVALAEFSGKRSPSAAKSNISANDSNRRKSPAKNASKPKKVADAHLTSSSKKEVPHVERGHVDFSRDIGISVKIEVILPSDASAETYESIFRSIRKNLIE